MLSPERLSVARIGDRSGKSAQALWDSLPPCIALSQTKTAQPASQANSEPTVDPKTACPGYRCRLLSYFMRFWLTNKDAVADELSLPFDRISLEMVYQGLYHFSVAYDKGEQTTPLSTLLLRRINT